MSPTSWTCTNVNGSTTTCIVTATSATSTVRGGATTSPLYIQDTGNISWGLSIIIFLLSFIFLGFVFNKFMKDL